MKDLSLFLLKNSLGAKMKKSFRSFCNGDGSTSTLNQHKTGSASASADSSCIPTQSALNTPCLDNAASGENAPTLEEMILQLELEEKMARKAKLIEYGGDIRPRMSCVNNSDILRSARNALNQYPRFSLDGKDAMYQSSFRNLPPIGRKSIGCSHGRGAECLPATLAGESVVWCKPGVVAKLMGLEAMPVAVDSKCSNRRFMSSIAKKQNLRRRAERQEQDRTRLVMDENGCDGGRRGIKGPSCSANPSRVMKAVAAQSGYDGAGWPIRRFP